MTPAGPATAIPARPVHSCVRCAERKVKCDRKTPCNACTRHNVECVYDPSQPRRNRHKRLSAKVLTDRIKHYEALLRERESESEPERPTAGTQKNRISSHTVAVSRGLDHSREPDLRRGAENAKVIHVSGRSRVINNVLWTGMVDEPVSIIKTDDEIRQLHDPHIALEDLSDGTHESEELEDDDFSFVLRSESGYKLKSRHPPPDDILQLGRIYIENVDPLTKIVHVPSLRSAIEKAAGRIDETPRIFEALLFSIYSAAIMSLNDAECRERFCEPRKVLLSRYISCTKDALSSARFMGTTSLVVLQALVNHLIVIRDIYEPRAIWSLSGVAVRIAQSMGLDRDGETLGLPPFETEIRRRVWWQLRMHDFRAAELCGVGKFQDLDTLNVAGSTKFPTNVNDDQLFSDMTSPAIEEKGVTDMFFVSLKCELLKFAASRISNLRTQGNSSSPWDPESAERNTAESDDSFQEIEETLEAKFLRYCDPSQPLQLITMLMARCSLNVIRFMAHHPRRWITRGETPQSERQLVWETCIKLLEQHSMLQSSPQLQRFAWQAPYTQQWHAIIHVLDTLRAEPAHVDAHKAWRLISNIYEHNPQMLCDMRKPIHVAVGNLCIQANSRREALADADNRYEVSAPDFIARLLDQREKFKSKIPERAPRDDKLDLTMSLDEDVPGCVQKPNSSSESDENATRRKSKGNQSPCADPSHIDVTLNPAGAVPSFGYGVESFGRVSMDLDFMVDQTYGTQGSGEISWDQWDAWLTESNMIPALPLQDKSDPCV